MARPLPTYERTERPQPLRPVPASGQAAWAGLAGQLRQEAERFLGAGLERRRAEIGEQASERGRQHGMFTPPGQLDLPEGHTDYERAFRQAALATAATRVVLEVEDTVGRLELEHEADPAALQASLEGARTGFVAKLPSQLGIGAEEQFQRLGQRAVRRSLEARRLADIDQARATLTEAEERLVVSAANAAKQGDLALAGEQLTLLDSLWAAHGPLAAGGSGALTETQVAERRVAAQRAVDREYVAQWVQRLPTTAVALAAITTGRFGDATAEAAFDRLPPEDQRRALTIGLAVVGHREREAERRETARRGLVAADVRAAVGLLRAGRMPEGLDRLRHLAGEWPELRLALDEEEMLFHQVREWAAMDAGELAGTVARLEAPATFTPLSARQADQAAKLYQDRLKDLRGELDETLFILKEHGEAAALDHVRERIRGTELEPVLARALADQEFLDRVPELTAPSARALLEALQAEPARDRQDVELARRMRLTVEDIERGVAEDPIATARRYNRIPPSQGLQLDPDSLRERARQAATVEAWRNVRTSGFDRIEAVTLGRALAEMPVPDRLQTLGAIGQVMGHERLTALAEQIAGEHPVLATAASFALERPDLAEKILRGHDLLQAGTIGRPQAWDWQDALARSGLVDAYSANPEALAAISDAALAVEAFERSQAGRLTSQEFDARVFRETATALVGGVVRWNGKHLVPPVAGMSEREFRMLIDSLTDEDLAQARGGPRTLAGEAIGIDALRRHGQLESIAEGLYRLRYVNGLALDGTGEPWELDLRGLLPTLAERVEAERMGQLRRRTGIEAATRPTLERHFTRPQLEDVLPGEAGPIVPAAPAGAEGVRQGEGGAEEATGAESPSESPAAPARGLPAAPAFPRESPHPPERPARPARAQPTAAAPAAPAPAAPAPSARALPAAPAFPREGPHPPVRPTRGQAAAPPPAEEAIVPTQRIVPVLPSGARLLEWLAELSDPMLLTIDPAEPELTAEQRAAVRAEYVRRGFSVPGLARP